MWADQIDHRNGESEREPEPVPEHRGRVALVLVMVPVACMAGSRSGLVGQRFCRRVAFVTLAGRSGGRGGGIAPGPLHQRSDIGDLDAGLVVVDRGAFRSVIHRDAFDARHLANPLFDFVRAPCRQQVAHFDYARFHRVSPPVGSTEASGLPISVNRMRVGQHAAHIKRGCFHGFLLSLKSAALCCFHLDVALRLFWSAGLLSLVAPQQQDDGAALDGAACA